MFVSITGTFIQILRKTVYSTLNFENEVFNKKKLQSFQNQLFKPVFPNSQNLLSKTKLPKLTFGAYLSCFPKLTFRKQLFKPKFSKPNSQRLIVVCQTLLSKAKFSEQGFQNQLFRTMFSFQRKTASHTRPNTRPVPCFLPSNAAPREA